MSRTRPEVVEKLVQAAMTGMLEGVKECSGDEVLSAYFTMLRRGIQATLSLNKHHPLTRQALLDTMMQLMAECADPDLRH